MKQTRHASIYSLSATLLPVFLVFTCCFRLPAQTWVKNYGIDGKIWLGKQIRNLPDGGFALSAQINQSHATLLARLDQNGDTLWTRNFPSTANGATKIPMALQTSPDGMLHCVMMDFHDWHCNYVRLDGSGNIVADFPVFDGPNYDYLISFTLTSDGIVFAGAKSEADSTLLIKRGFDGSLIWTKSLPTPGGVVDMEQTADGEFVLLVETDNYDYEIVKTDPNGQFLWRAAENTFTYRGGIAIQPNGDIIYASQAIAFTDIYLMKLSPDGVLLDIVLDSIFPGKEKQVETIVSDTTGNLYLTGSVWFNEDGYDHELLLAKYDPEFQRAAIQTYDNGETFWTGWDLVLSADYSVVICSSRKTDAEWPDPYSTSLITVMKIPIDQLSPVEAIPERAKHPLVVQPNPFCDQVLFTFEEAEAGLKIIRLFDLEGKMVLEQAVNSSSCQLWGSDLPLGALFYQVEEHGRTIASGTLVHGGD